MAHLPRRRDKTSKQFYQPYKIDRDSEEKSPPPETATESLIPLPAQKMEKKRRQRKRKIKKITAVVVIKGRRTKPGTLSGKYRLKLPKKFTGNCLPLIALCLFCQCHPVHSVSKKSVEDINEDVAPMRSDGDEICDNVSVTDFPIVIKQDDRNKTFQEQQVIYCPQRVDILKSCSACFKNKSTLEISCRKNTDADNGPMWVEHGKGQGISDNVALNSEACHKIQTGVREIQSDRSDGKTSAENNEGSEGILWIACGLLVICIMAVPAILAFVTQGCTLLPKLQPHLHKKASICHVKCKRTPLLPCYRVSKMADLRT